VDLSRYSKSNTYFKWHAFRKKVDQEKLRVALPQAVSKSLKIDTKKRTREVGGSRRGRAKSLQRRIKRGNKMRKQKTLLENTGTDKKESDPSIVTEKKEEEREREGKRKSVVHYRGKRQTRRRKGKKPTESRIQKKGDETLRGALRETLGKKKEETRASPHREMGDGVLIARHASTKNKS